MKKNTRIIRHNRIRSRLRGTAARPRACVSRSLTRLTVQLIDDDAQRTLTTASGKPTEVGKTIGDNAKKLGITKIVFDRGGYQYHGQIKTVAEAMREAGLEF